MQGENMEEEMSVGEAEDVLAPEEEITEPQNELENDDISEMDFDSDSDEEQSGEEKADEDSLSEKQEPKPKKQTKAENAEFAKKRRQQEAVIKKREEDAYRKGQLDLLIGSKNTFTGEEIVDADDVSEFLLMKEAEKAGFDPTSELSKFQKHKAREERKLKETSFDVNADVKNFKEAYPDVDLQALIKDEEFSEFAEPFAQKMPLATIFKQYRLMKSKTSIEADRKAEEKYKRKIASPGSLTSSGGEKAVSFDDMSDEEFEKYIAKAKRGDLLKS